MGFKEGRNDSGYRVDHRGVRDDAAVSGAAGEPQGAAGFGVAGWLGVPADCGYVVDWAVLVGVPDIGVADVGTGADGALNVV